MSLATFLASIIGGTALDARYAYAQLSEQTVAQIKEDAQSAAYLSNRIDKRVRQLRTIVYFTLGLTVIGLALTGYMALQKSPWASGGVLQSRGDAFSRWRGNAALARTRRQQQKLARVLTDLQDFAAQARDTNKEMSALLESANRQMNEIETALATPPIAASVPKS